jgi:hypothetical protein
MQVKQMQAKQEISSRSASGFRILGSIGGRASANLIILDRIQFAPKPIRLNSAPLLPGITI